MNYREKSPFEYRGWNLCISPKDSDSLVKPGLLCSRNKENSVWVSSTDPYYLPFGHTIKHTLLSSPVYDPEETEYWPTDEEGNPLSVEISQQPNPFSEKTIEALAAAVIQTMQTTGTRKVFLGAEDSGGARYVPYDTQPFEYAPGQFVYPEDENYYSTVIHTMINKVARIVRESIPDGMVGTWAYWIEIIPPACEIEDNVYIIFAPLEEDMCYSICDQGIKDKKVTEKQKSYCDWIEGWSQKTDNLAVYNYYCSSKASAYFERALWSRMQTDLQDYVRLGVMGLTPEGEPDADGYSSWFSELGENAGHCVWSMNVLTYWLYGRLSWNPYEDLQSLIDLFCEKVYGPAAESMKEYYRLIKDSWDENSKTCRFALEHSDLTADYYKTFIYKPGIGHDVLDILEKAYNEADGPVKEVIGYVRECYVNNLKGYKNF